MKRTQLTTTADLTREEVDFFINEAEALREKRTKDLEGKICASLFFEPSTRTRLSFESAIHRLDGKLLTVSSAGSTSAKKGESLTDTIRMAEKYADILILRHPKSGAAKEAISVTKKPFLNAGDGANQHPTQALLDMLTIKREKGEIEGITIGFVGDMKFGRTVHSLLYLLRLYKVKKLLFITPEELKLPEEYKKILDEAGVKYEEKKELEASIPEMDLIYMTRIQGERFEKEEDYLKLKGVYVLTKKMVESGKKDLKIMHPLPRIDEIETAVDEMPQAAYYRQAENGIFMRMALLKNLSKNFYG